MNCKDVQDVAFEIAREQMIEATIRAEALRHIAECESCAATLDAEQALTRDLRGLRSAMQSINAPDRIQARLLERLRAEQFPETVIRSSTSLRYGRYAAIAAMLLLVVGIIVMRSRLQSPPTTRNESLPISTTKTIDSFPLNSKNVTTPPDAIINNQVAMLRPVSNNKLRAARSTKTARKPVAPVDHVNQSSDEVATDFLPIGYTSLLNVQDGGQIVRVELPRSTMARFGFPVNMDRYDEKVKADVLVSSDGMARAIRFVQ